MAKKRFCKGITKAGKPCKAAPLKGSDHCAAHDPDTPPSARFGAPAQAREAGKQGGRPRNPRMVDVLRERMEEDVDAWLDVLTDAREATYQRMIGHGEYAEIVEEADHRARLRAFREAFDRAYGRPVQPTELSTPKDQPLRISAELLSDPEVRDGLSAVKRRVADSRAERP